MEKLMTHVTGKKKKITYLVIQKSNEASENPLTHTVAKIKQIVQVGSSLLRC